MLRCTEGGYLREGVSRQTGGGGPSQADGAEESTSQEWSPRRELAVGANG